MEKTKYNYLQQLLVMWKNYFTLHFTENHDTKIQVWNKETVTQGFSLLYGHAPTQ